MLNLSKAFTSRVLQNRLPKRKSINNGRNTQFHLYNSSRCVFRIKGPWEIEWDQFWRNLRQEIEFFHCGRTTKGLFSVIQTWPVDIFFFITQTTMKCYSCTPPGHEINNCSGMNDPNKDLYNFRRIIVIMDYIKIEPIRLKFKFVPEKHATFSSYRFPGKSAFISMKSNIQPHVSRHNYYYYESKAILFGRNGLCMFCILEPSDHSS